MLFTDLSDYSALKIHERVLIPAKYRNFHSIPRKFRHSAGPPVPTTRAFHPRYIPNPLYYVFRVAQVHLCWLGRPAAARYLDLNCLSCDFTGLPGTPVFLRARARVPETPSPSSAFRLFQSYTRPRATFSPGNRKLVTGRLWILSLCRLAGRVIADVLFFQRSRRVGFLGSRAGAVFGSLPFYPRLH